jgi:hypothetical protein
MANFDITENNVKTAMEPEELKPVTYNNNDFEISVFTGQFPAGKNQHSFVNIDIPFENVVSYDVLVVDGSGLKIKSSSGSPANAKFGHNLTSGGVYLYTFTTSESAFVFGKEATITITSRRS